MKTTLPTLDIREENGKIIKTESEINIEVIDSVVCQIKWENNFPIDAAKISLLDYIDKYRSATKKKWNSATCLSALKGLFCFLEFEKPITFYEFCKLFKFSDLDFFNKFTNKITEIFNLVYPQEKKKD